jgi:hypothetical protein
MAKACGEIIERKRKSSESENDESVAWRWQLSGGNEMK